MAESLAGKVLISSSSSDVRIVGSLPDEFNISMEQEYTNLLSGGASDALQGATQAITGESLHFDNKFFHTWTGGHPLMLSWDMTLVAQSSASGDIISPLRELMKLVAARKGSRGNLAAPQGRSDRVSVKFGNILTVPDCLITNVSPTPSRPLLVGGIPARIPVSITIRTKNVMTQDDINSMIFPGMV